MKILLSPKFLFGAAAALSLVACGGDSDGNNNGAPAVNTAPQINPSSGFMAEHVVSEQNLREAASNPVRAYEVDLLEGVYDTDPADTLGITNFNVEALASVPVEGQDDNWIIEQGIYRLGSKLFVDMNPIAVNLNSGERISATITYDVTDGEASVQRSFTVHVDGYDNAPGYTDETLFAVLVANFTKDATDAQIDLLRNVIDLDLDPLTASNLVTDPDNALAPAVSIADNVLTVDVEAVRDGIVDGETTVLNYTYDISDGVNTITRDLVVNLLGVNDVPGAPLIGSYFLSEMLAETDAPITVDLIDDVTEREGDPILVSNLMVNGSADMPFGVELEGTDLHIDPHAFFSQVEVGGVLQMVVTFNISDDQGNVSDGERELTVIINGVESSLLPSLSSPADGYFDNPAYMTASDAGWGAGFPNDDCAESIEPSGLNGSGAVEIRGSSCNRAIANIINPLEADKKYVVTYWYYSPGAESMGNNEPWTVVPGTAFFGNNGAFGSTWERVPAPVPADTWYQESRMIDSAPGGGYADRVGEALALHFGIGYGPGGGAVNFDNIRVIDYTDFDFVAHDLLVGNVGVFEGDESEIMSDFGSLTISADDKLVVDTTGTAAGVNVSLPVKMGAIRDGSHYILRMDVEVLSGTEENISVSVTNGSETVEGRVAFRTGDAVAVAGSVTTSDILFVLPAPDTPTGLDWSGDDVTLVLSSTSTDTEYEIDNVRMIELP